MWGLAHIRGGVGPCATNESEGDVLVGTEWWAHTLTWGSAAVVLSGATLLAVMLTAPYAFLSDYPADIRARAPKPSRAQQRAGRFGSAVFLLVLISAIGAAVCGWGVVRPGASYFELALMALVLNLMFVLLDVIVIDWLIVCTLRPGRLIYPGTEECAGWGDYRFHLTEQFKPIGVSVLLGGSAGIGLVAWWLI